MGFPCCICPTYIEERGHIFKNVGVNQKCLAGIFSGDFPSGFRKGRNKFHKNKLPTLPTTMLPFSFGQKYEEKTFGVWIDAGLFLFLIELKLIIQRYRNDPIFANQSRWITSLAFLPIGDLTPGIIALDRNLMPELQPIMDW